MDSAYLLKFMALANRHSMRKLMAECLPVAMHDMFERKGKAVGELLACMDPTITEVFMSKVVELSSVSRCACRTSHYSCHCNSHCSLSTAVL